MLIHWYFTAPHNGVMLRISISSALEDTMKKILWRQLEDAGYVATTPCPY